MKPEKPPTLSRHLRDQANKFFPVYPHREERTTLPLEDQREIREWVNEALEKTFEQFLTFVPNSKALKNDQWKKANVLDDVLCRILLRDVPEMARLANMIHKELELYKLVLPESNARFWFYLRESAKCLIFGLSQASVALARAAIESCLRETYAHWFGKKEAYAEKTTLAILIKDLVKRRPVLSQAEETWARDVKKAANKVLHDRPIEAEEALRVFGAARLLIQTRASKANR